MEKEKLLTLSDQFAALGNPARLHILHALVRSPDGRSNASELQSAVGMPASTTSHHLDKLLREQLIRREREGTTLWYSANWAELQNVVELFAQDCCGGQCSVDFSCCAHNNCSPSCACNAQDKS